MQRWLIRSWPMVNRWLGDSACGQEQITLGAALNGQRFFLTVCHQLFDSSFDLLRGVCIRL
jgi:hypothetical protein